MVSCRSCGRNIASGTIRCSNCSSPFHLSCSHRYKISPEGVFNVCCGPIESLFPGGGSYQMRTRNKRRRQNNINNLNNRNNSNNSNQIAGTEQNDNIMRYGKIQKTEPKMGIADKPVLDNIDNQCNEVNEVNEVIEENLNNESDIIEFETNDVIEEANDVPNDTEEPSQQESIVVNSNKQSNDKITLETVWQGISALQNSISNISNSLDTVSTQLNTFDPRINELESSINAIKTKTTDFENVQNDVSGLKDKLEQIVNELENLKSNQPEKELDISQVFSEMKERDMKSKNIIIYNVLEDNLRISQDYSTIDDINKFNALVQARDASRAREILENVPNVDLDDLETRRLGRPNPNFCRPLRVTLQSKEDVITIMKNKNCVNRQYTVKTDLTKYQQQRIKELKEELEKVNVNKSNPTMTIKFINGEPKMIPIRKNFMKPEM